MSSNSYWEGRSGQGFYGGNYTDYIAGKNDAVNSSGGGNPIILLMLLFFVLPAGIQSVIASVFISFALIWFLKQMDHEIPVQPYGRTYKSVLKIVFFSLIAGTTIGFFISILSGVDLASVFMWNENLQNRSDLSFTSILFPLFLYLAPVTLFSAILLKNQYKVYAKLKGVAGFGRAFAFSLVVILPIVAVISYSVTKLILTYVMN